MPRAPVLLASLIVAAMSAYTFDDVLAGYDEAVTAFEAGDYETALGDFRAAAAGNDPRAFYMLGRMYQIGVGVEPDDARAVAWYREAAERGHNQAQSTLGMLYLYGVGVEPDDVEAYAWFALAVEGGHRAAKSNRDLVVRRLGADRLAEAETLLRSRRDAIAGVQFAPPVGNTNPIPDIATAAPDPPQPVARAEPREEDGGFRVQLGAYSVAAYPLDAWESLASAHSDLLAGLEPRVTKVDRDEQGILYLLRIGPLTSPDAARALCRDLDAQGVDCLVVDP